MITRIFRVNTLTLFMTLVAVLFTLGACAVNRNNLTSARQYEYIFDGDPESCSMCHVDVEIEILKAKTKHMEAGVDCITCHGWSIGHIQNEINGVKPDRVITKETTNSFCHGCHDTSSSHDEKIISRMVCTKCHDEHATFVPGK
jgi:hypothetical protein